MSEVRVNFSDGEAITSWVSFSMRESFVDPLGSLEFTVKPPRDRIEEYRNRLARGQLVTLLIDGVSQGGYVVQSRQIAVSSSDGVYMSISCVSPLAAAYEGAAGKLDGAKGYMLPQILSSQTDTSVQDVILSAFEPYGFSAIVGDSDLLTAGSKAGKSITGQSGTIIVSALKQQQARSQDGETAYEFASRIFKRFGVVLHVGISGNLVLSAPDFNQSPLYGVHQTFGDSVSDSNRFLGDPPLIIDETNDGQFSDVIVRGTRTVDDFGEKFSAHPVARVRAIEFNPEHPPYQSDVSPWKPLYHVDKNARDAVACQAIATLIMGIHAAKSYTISGTVDGLKSATGAIWTVNTCVNVRIDAAVIREKMWILSREMTGSVGSGQMTKLTIIPAGNLRLGEVPQ